MGDNNRNIVNSLILDIIENSKGKNYIKLSDKVYKAVKNLKNFNYENIYYKANNEESLNYYKRVFTELFEYYRNNINDKNNSINTVFLNGMDEKYLSSTSNERKIIDYLAGMTDSFIIKEYEKIKKSEETN